MSIGVAIIDSGVHPGHPHVRDLTAGRNFVPGGEPGRYLDYLGHGTAVAGAICEKGAPLRLYIAKVFERRLVTSIDVLLAALDWSLEQPVAHSTERPHRFGSRVHSTTRSTTIHCDQDSGALAHRFTRVAEYLLC